MSNETKSDSAKTKQEQAFEELEFILSSAGSSVYREPLSAEEMLRQLEENYHEVVLIPAGEEVNAGAKIRVAQSQNCDWYRAFAAQYTNQRGIGRKQMRRARTYISKLRTKQALERIIKDETKGVYVERLLDFMARYFKQEDVPF